MKKIALYMVLIGIVDQVDNSTAHIEWENNTWTHLDIEMLPETVEEGSTIQLTLSPPSSQQPEAAPQITYPAVEPTHPKPNHESHTTRPR